jgi:hypothetical protein
MKAGQHPMTKYTNANMLRKNVRDINLNKKGVKDEKNYCNVNVVDCTNTSMLCKHKMGEWLF